MRNKTVLLMLLIIVFGLSACNLEEEADDIVRAKVKKKYGIDVQIVEHESINEGNGGDRTFVLKSKEEIPVTFEVYLKGFFSSRVTGDNYKKQKKAATAGGEFVKKNKKKLESIGYPFVEFSEHEGLHATAVYDRDIDIYDEKSVDRLFQFIHLLNKNKPAPESLTLIKPEAFDVDFENLDELDSKDALLSILAENTDIVNDSLFQRDLPEFTAIGEGIAKRGYVLGNGLTAGGGQSFYCPDENVQFGECNGGYLIWLKSGKMDNESLFGLISFLKSQPLWISTISFPDKGIYLELDKIQSASDIVVEPK